MHRLTTEEVELLQDMCLDDSTKIIRYLDKKFKEQDKENRKNTVFTVINTILALIAAIFGVLSFFF